MNKRLNKVTFFPVLPCLLILSCIYSISSQQCDITGSNRFNCYPERNITRKACETRGCCWVNSTNVFSIDGLPQITAPLCYYPSNFPSYTVVSSDDTDFGKRIHLQLPASIRTNDAVPHLTVDICFETSQRLRIKIYDADNDRYQVPLGVPIVTKKVDDMDYQVDVTSEPFSIKVTRKITGAVLFDSSVAPLIFQDQFIKISTKLSSPLLYGLGEHRQPLLINITNEWQRLTFYTHDFPPIQNVNLYGVHPFHINPEIDDEVTSFHGQFFLNSNAMDVELQPSPALTYTTIGGIIDLYVFTGPKVQDVIKQYWDVIGKPTLPPYWSLGFHLSRYGYNDSTNLKKTMKRMQAADFPYDVQWTDVDVMENYIDFTYDAQRFGDLADIVVSLQSLGQRYMTAINSGFSNDPASPTYTQFSEGVTQGIFIRTSSGSDPIIGKVACGTAAFPDFSHVNISNWWTRLIAEFHDKINFDGIWLNKNEPSNLVDGSINGCSIDKWNNPPFTPYVFGKELSAKSICPSAVHNSSIHYNLHNLYGYFQAQKTQEALQTVLQKRSFLVSRSTFSGSGKYTAHWTGDNRSTFKDMYFSIPDIISFNMFGITHVGADVCGFGLDTTEELCTRWMQLGAFYPFMRNHNDRGQRDQDPASFSWQAQQIMKQALLMRYSLIPFWYTLHYKAATNSETIIQPLFAEFSDATDTYSIDQQFLVGRSILVSPVLASNVSTIRAFIPQDTWYEFPSGVPLTTVGQYVNLDAPLQKINVHVRGRSIIPMQVAGPNLMLARCNPFQLLVALGDSNQASGSLYWDDGESNDWNDSKAYNYFEFSVANFNTLLIKTIVPGYQDCKMQLSLVKVLGLTLDVIDVTVNNAPYENYVYDSDDDILIVHSLEMDMLSPIIQNITWSTSELGLRRV